MRIKELFKIKNLDLFIFSIALISSTIGVCADTVIYIGAQYSFLFWLNIVSLGFTAINCLLFIFKILTIKKANLFLVYNISVNLLLTDLHYLALGSSCWQVSLLRNSFIYFMMVLAAGFVNHKRHPLILDSLYLIFLVVASTITEIKIINENTGMFAMSMIISTFGVIAYRNRLSQIYQEKIQLQKNVVKAENETLQKEKQIVDERMEHLEDLLQQKKRELTSNTLLLASNAENNKKMWKMVKAIFVKYQVSKNETTTVQRGFSDITKQEIWKDFQLRFEEVHQSFFINLDKVHPELTMMERRLAAFIKLELSSKEIASLTAKTPQSTDVARSRLRKKLNLSTSENISDYLKKF